MMNNKASLKKSIRKNALILALFAMASTALVSVVHQLTKEKIKSEIQRVMTQQLNKLVPPDSYNNSPISDCVIIKNYTKINQTTIQKIHLMKQNEKPIAMVFTSIAHNGYSGDIKLLIALSNQNKLLGVEILSHTETPGLGDKIESNKSNWLHQFKNLDLTSFASAQSALTGSVLTNAGIIELDNKRWRVKKDGGNFDALTGATITPRATINATYQTIQFFLENKAKLFSSTVNCNAKIGR